MILRLSFILSILLTQNLFANEDFITLKGLNVATPYGKVESILTKKGYECDITKGKLDDGTPYVASYCETIDGKIIMVDYHANVFIGLDGKSTEIYTVLEIDFTCDSLNACGRGKELVDLLVRKYKLIYMTETDIDNYNRYDDWTRRTPYLIYDIKYEYYRNPNNNDVLFYFPKYESFEIMPYKYKSEELKEMEKRKRKQIEESFDLD